jgi:Glycosyl transferase family 2
MSETEDRRENADGPDLSVILVVGGQRERAAAALRSLVEQSAIDQMEILLFDLGPDECPSLPNSDHFRVRMTSVGRRYLLAGARARGIRMARAPVIAFVEEHCLVEPGWAEAIIHADWNRWAGIGCHFLPANPNSGSSDKAFRMTYGIYIRPSPARGPTNFISGQNSAFKRDVLLRYDDQLELMMNADLVLQKKMRDAGYELFQEPAARIAHRNENTMPSLAVGAFYWNWCFSNVRAQVFEWSLPHKAFRVAVAPLIPWFRLAKLCLSMPRQGKEAMLQFVLDIPYIIAIHHCSVAGQVAGLLNKLDIGAREFSHFEMNEPRLDRTELMQ